MQLFWPLGPPAERSYRATSPEFVNGNSFCSVYGERCSDNARVRSCATAKYQKSYGIQSGPRLRVQVARSQIEEQLGAERQKCFWTQNDNACTVTPGFLVIRSTSNSCKQRFWKLRRAVVLTVVCNARDVETVSLNWPFTSEYCDESRQEPWLDKRHEFKTCPACGLRRADRRSHQRFCKGLFITPARIVDGHRTASEAKHRRQQLQ